jgi:hypothetical protein
MNRFAFHTAAVPEDWEQTMEAFSLRPVQCVSFAEEVRCLIDDLRAMEPAYRDVQVSVTIVVGALDRHAARAARPPPR